MCVPLSCLQGYLDANSASAYSMVSLVQKFGPIMNEGGAALSLTYIASEKVIPGYGGGMSSAKVRERARGRTMMMRSGRQARHGGGGGTDSGHLWRRTKKGETRADHPASCLAVCGVVGGPGERHPRAGL